MVIILYVDRKSQKLGMNVLISLSGIAMLHKPNIIHKNVDNSQNPCAIRAAGWSNVPISGCIVTVYPPIAFPHQEGEGAGG